MPVGHKDLKILWAKAAGRCSMPDCRQALALEASSGVPSKALLIGEVCHIVAEKEDGPRGRSLLTPEERNRYPNLLVLCANHHIIIDGDPTEWPVERLHQIKSDHELWVESQLTDATATREDKFYSALINAATEDLCLASWDGISDHAIRGLLFESFVEGTARFSSQVFRAMWPGTRPDLESEIKNLASRVDSYIRYFMTKASRGNDAVWSEDKTWKERWVSDYQARIAESEAWSQGCANLLGNVVVALNSFASSVRAELNPDYFLLQGRFVICDSLGVTNRMRATEYLPEGYVE